MGCLFSGGGKIRRAPEYRRIHGNIKGTIYIPCTYSTRSNYVKKLEWWLIGHSSVDYYQRKRELRWFDWFTTSVELGIYTVRVLLFGLDREC